MIQLDSRYTICGGIKYRYEDFGGIIYRRHDDRLFLMNSKMAIDLLEMADQGTVEDIVSMLNLSKIYEQNKVRHVLNVLNRLKELGIIYELV